MNYKTKSNKVVFDDGKIIKLAYPVYKTELVGNVLIVLLESGTSEIYNENVFGIDVIKKEIIWQIPKIGYVDENSPYTQITVKKKNIVAYNWSGDLVTINPKTGKIQKKVYMK
jgi:hypothetical protein